EAIDAEVRSLLEEAHGRALEILRAHPDGLERVVEALLERERLDRAEFEALLRDADAPARGLSRGPEAQPRFGSTTLRTTPSTTTAAPASHTQPRPCRGRAS